MQGGIAGFLELGDRRRQIHVGRFMLGFGVGGENLPYL